MPRVQRTIKIQYKRYEVRYRLASLKPLDPRKIKHFFTKRFYNFCKEKLPDINYIEYKEITKIYESKIKLFN